MLLDASLLRRANVDNLERLARALGVDTPKRRRDTLYQNQLVSALASRIRRDAMMDELKRLTSLVGAGVGNARTGTSRVAQERTTVSRTLRARS